MKWMIPISLLLITFLVVGAGCSKESELGTKPELMIYCGMTMLKPMEEIAGIVELEQNCIVRILAGGSGSLLRSIEHSRVGDLYLPGDESFILQCRDKNILIETALVGFNQAALVVLKGNPLKINADIRNLANSSFSVILADPENGSIGREARRILIAQEVFEEVLANSMALVADSEDITEAIKLGLTDLSMSWYAVAQWPNNSSFIEAVVLPDNIAPRKKLVLGQLVFSAEKELAKIFMDYTVSDEGRRIFQSYGFLKPSDL